MNVHELSDHMSRRECYEKIRFQLGVTSQRKPAVQGDEVGHESGLPPPAEGCNCLNKEGQSPGDRPDQPESFHEVKMVNRL